MCSISMYGLHGVSKGDEHPALHLYWLLYPLLFSATCSIMCHTYAMSMTSIHPSVTLVDCSHVVLQSEYQHMTR